MKSASFPGSREPRSSSLKTCQAASMVVALIAWVTLIRSFSPSVLPLRVFLLTALLISLKGSMGTTGVSV